jgi:hypothetical protein
MVTTQRKRLTSGNLHFPVDGKPEDKAGEGATLKNHQEAAGDLLFDPKDAAPGATHSDKPVQVKASVEDGDEDLGIDSLEEVMPPSGEETDDLYASDEEGVLDSLLEDGEEELTDEVDELGVEEEIPAELDEVEESFGGEMGVDDPAFAGGEEVVSEKICGEEGVPLVDIDETADELEDEDLAFASLGASLHCIKANRIVASMTKKDAVTAKCEDIYQDDNFPEIVMANVQQKGLRKGLIASGFKLSKVAIDSNAAVKASVAAKVASARKELSASTKKHDETMQQCLALAAVGIDRGFFKGVANPLRASLETELQQAGVRGGSKVVRSLFAKYGVDYSRAMIQVATKLAAMPEETRNQLSDALDMTEVAEVLDEEEDTEDFDPDLEVEDDDDLPETVSAAVRRPAHRSTRVNASSQTQKGSVQEILSGAKPLPFIR